MSASPLLYLVTGASRGIGLAFVQQILETEPQSLVIAAARNTSSASLQQLKSQYNARVALLPMDVDSDESVAEAAKKVAANHSHINYLINNAGVIGAPDSSAKNFLKVLDTNVVGNVRVIEAFLPLLKKATGDKVVAGISSLAGSIATVKMNAAVFPTEGAHFYPYRVSKAAVNNLYAGYACDNEKHGIIFATTHPGFVDTDMAKESGIPATPISTKESVQKQLELFHRLKLEDSGKFFLHTGEVAPF